MKTDSEPSLAGLKVVSFESRRAAEMAKLIRRYGGDPIMAPSVREVPLSENTAAFDFLRELEAGRLDLAIFLTGVGTRALVEAISSQYPRERLTAALSRIRLVARGPKPAAALKELGLVPHIRIPEPNTWREVLSELDANVELREKRVAIQEYGITNKELIAGLEARGAEIMRVPVYRWMLPQDLEPLRGAIRRMVATEVDVALFTNATQVMHLFQVAEQEGFHLPLRRALERILIASIGPVCSEALEQFDLKADLEPEHPKMGHLIAALARSGRSLLERKRERTDSP
ncbi:MAG: uroporphyrinogen-III synthase [Deltaproteobacteria bacterium]|nr:uroporphyrinogen-III synthase [Deltaproteobacteria bacterium]